MAAVKPALLGLTLLMASSLLRAEILTYTHLDSSCDGCRPLGYPVPLPAESLTPGAYFRSYERLQDHLSALALAQPDIRRVEIGQSVANRPIYAYLLGDPDSTTAEGLIEEAAVLQNGGIHAREWGTPEVVAGIVEQLAEQAGGNGLERYLLDNLSMVVIPVLNVDGFLQTQRFPDQALVSEDGDVQRANDPNYPRDGRMRRKNMRGPVNELLDENNDGMLGVDLNRNNPPFWANSAPTRSSSRFGSIVHHGASAASEPETQALQAAAHFGPADRLRLYIDTHSFTRIYFAPYTGNSRRDRLQDRIAHLMRVVPATRYNYGPSGPGGEIGSTDEYFAYTYQIPSYTLELEPGPDGGRDYGGFGVSHDGFVLPAAELPRVREELAAASLLGYYHQAGPPILEQVLIEEASTAQAVLDSRWQTHSARERSLSAERANPLVAGREYRLQLSFNKPMRVRDALGQIDDYAGQSTSLAPSLQLEARFSGGRSETLVIDAPISGWMGADRSRYDDDQYQVAFSLPAQWQVSDIQRLSLAVSVSDLANQALDAQPATVVDWVNGSWSGYEDGQGRAGDLGGDDRYHRLIDDGSPVIPDNGGNNQSSGGGQMGGALSLAPWALLTWALRRRRIHLPAGNR